MLDQFGLDVGPGFVGGGGDTVQSISLAFGGDGSGGWEDPGTWNQYASTQQDVGAIRNLAATQGNAIVVTGNGSLSNGGDMTAYLPQAMQNAGIQTTPGILGAYQGVTGQAYKPGSDTAYNPATGKYDITGGAAAPAPVQQKQSFFQSLSNTPTWKSDIQNQLAALSTKNSQAELDKWLASSTYSLDQLAEASGYNKTDIQNAINRAKSGASSAPSWKTDIQSKLAGLNGKTQADLDQWLANNPYSVQQLAEASGYKPEDIQAAINRAHTSGAIRNQLSSLTAQGSQSALDQWLSNSSYTPDQLAAASGYNVADIQAAIARAKAAAQPKTGPEYFGQDAQAAELARIRAMELQKTSGVGQYYTAAQQAAEQARIQAMPASVAKAPTNTANMPTTGLNLSQLQDAKPWEVTADQTVKSQLEQIIAQDSPLMQQARIRALQQANGAGLLNSSMAVTAGQSAVLGAATPIAQADANTYAQAAQFNTDTSNTFARENNAFVRDGYMADFNLKANDWASQQAFEREFAKLDQQQKYTLERDAIQQGYNSAADKFAADTQAEQNATAYQRQLERDAVQQGYKSAADKFAAEERSKEAAIAYQRQLDQAAIQNSYQSARDIQQNQFSKEQTAYQLEANKSQAASNAEIESRQMAMKTLTDAKADFATRVYDLNTKDLPPEKADKAFEDLKLSYNSIIKSAVTTLGFSNPDSWLIA